MFLLLIILCCAMGYEYMYTRKLTFHRKPEVKLIQSGMYGVVRHPVYAFMLLSFWIVPRMVSTRFLVHAGNITEQNYKLHYMHLHGFLGVGIYAGVDLGVRGCNLSFLKDATYVHCCLHEHNNQLACAAMTPQGIFFCCFDSSLILFTLPHHDMNMTCT